MKLHELKVIDGTYVAVRALPATQALMDEWALNAGITLDDNLHITLLYSRVALNVNVQPDEHVVTPLKLDMLGDAIVLKLNAPSIVTRHEQFKAMGGTHDFSSFVPHMTVLAKPEGVKVSDLPPINFGLVFGNEYTEALRN